MDVARVGGLRPSAMKHGFLTTERFLSKSLMSKWAMLSIDANLSKASAFPLDSCTLDASALLSCADPLMDLANGDLWQEIWRKKVSRCVFPCLLQGSHLELVLSLDLGHCCPQVTSSMLFFLILNFFLPFFGIKNVYSSPDPNQVS